MAKNPKKRGYYFSIEALLAILILTVSFLLMTTMFESPTPLPDYRYATNLAGFMSHVTVADICTNGCEGLELQELALEYGIYNSSIIDMIGYTYFKSHENIKNVSKEIFEVGGLLQRGKQAAIIIRGIECDVIYSTQPVDCEQGANATNEVVFRKVISGYVLDENSGTTDFWGDYIFEVRVW